MLRTSSINTYQMIRKHADTLIPMMYIFISLKEQFLKMAHLLELAFAQL
jgi:hypothetical protein